jgi:hypothetical protein
MPHPEVLKQWAADLSKHLPQLSKSQVFVLALYSLATTVLGACGLESVSYFWAEIYQSDANNFRQRLREWYSPKSCKKGRQRQEVCVQSQFAALMAWILSYWRGEKQIALVLDATTLGERFVVLVVSLVYRGTAIPVAWAILKPHEKEAWQGHWLALLRLLQGSIPKNWTVLVLTDRGLYAKWLFEAIRACGWHPFMRINAQGFYKRPRSKSWKSLKGLLRPAMGVWIQKVVCFKTEESQLACTLLAQWEGNYEEGCLILSDLAPDELCFYWYDLRQWAEQGFKDFKYGGWRWEQTRMSDPQRAERLWLVLAVATLKVCLYGTNTTQDYSASGFRQWLKPKYSKLSVFRKGRIRFLAAIIRNDPLEEGYFMPHDWHKTPL